MPARAARRAVARLAQAGARLALAGVAVGVVAGACSGPLDSPTPVPAASGSTTERRALADFSSVSVDGPLNVVVAVGAVQAVTVDGPANLVPLVTTAVAGTELAVGVAPPGFASAGPVTVRITAPAVRALALRGRATGIVEATGQTLAVSVGDGSGLRGIGAVRQLAVTLLGDAEAELGDLTADVASISAAGGARVTLTVARQLTGTADGGSTVTLTTAPTARSVALTGGARVVGP